jgi:hypothetical protein
MRADRNPQDPYAPPPRHKDRSGAVVRVALIAAMLGAAVWGYTEFSRGPSQSLVAEQAQEQQVADAGYNTTPEAIPQGAPATSTPAPAAPAEAAPSAPAPGPAPSEPVPPPSTTITP